MILSETTPNAPLPPPPAELLQQLFALLKISVSRGAWRRAVAQIEQTLPAETPLLQRLNGLIKQLKLRGVQPAQLLWRRFDQRKLPVLLWLDGQWLLVAAGEETPRFITAEGETITPADAALDEAVVLWLRVQQPEAETALFSSRNIAARMVWRALFAKTGWLRDIMIATLVINLLAVSTSLFAMQVYDRVVPTLAYATLWTLVAGMAGVVGLDWLLKTYRARVLDSVASRADRSVSAQVFDHLLRLRIDLQPKSTGVVASQVGGLDSVRQFFSSGVIFVLIDMPFALLFIALIATIGGNIAWVYLLLLPLAILIGFITQIRLRRLFQQQLQRIHERQGMLVDTLRGAETIRANNAGWRFNEQWHQLTETVAHYHLRQKSISNFATVTTSTLATSAYVSAVVVGVTLIEAGSLTMGGLIACSILGGRVIAPVAQGIQQLSHWHSVTQALQMVNQLLKIESERQPGQRLLTPDQPPTQIALDRVRFSYPNSPVKQVDIEQLQFKAGDRVMLIGSVGGGKSTLLKLLAGLYRPTEGRVTLGEGDMWQMEPQLVNNFVGYLPQTVHLFKGTLRSNLALSGAVDDNRFLEVCHALGVDRIAADNPQSMELEISEGGDGLSGGQRQLVALARLIMARPRIWLMDEPTASLDSDSERNALAVLSHYLREEDIVLFATHRPVIAATVANRAIVIQQGKVVQDGTPQQILQQLQTQRVAPQRGAVFAGGVNHVV
ncbi:ATP-binding cassette domain-containing protein [Ectothiorhodospiraceae bacterium BW-2]|nr:ATP-binding cassette domain-containing protein [Ectothiorhodospiraceae bacterium BW-2]